jgi:diadenosine tetraphosphate (Ap4A) HIT family hydrolase
MNKKHCPFCSLDVQQSAFANKSGFMAVPNHSPILPGHALIIPEQHIERLYELTDEQIGRFFTFARVVTGFITQLYDADAYDWSLQEGEAAGQSVSHLHLHIIPRHTNDLKPDEDWYVKLQASKAIDDSTREIMDKLTYDRLSKRLKTDWLLYNSEDK